MKYSFLSILLVLANTILSQPSIEWQRCLGGTDAEGVSFILETSDGGYILIGSTSSNDGDVTGYHEGYTEWGQPLGDLWVVKLNQNGDIEWQKCLGGSGFDGGSDIKQTADGGYIIIGSTDSTDGDVADIHMDQDGSIRSDIWIIKLDADGTLLWQKCFGGTQVDAGTSIEMLDDGSFVFCGWTLSNDGDVSFHHGLFFGNTDIWVAKIDTLGNLEWEKSLGGSNNDVPADIKISNDGGFIVSGSTESNDGDVIGFHPDSIGLFLSDIWTVKLTEEGNIEWQLCLGGSGTDSPSSEMVTAPDGSIFISGSTNSTDGDIEGIHLDFMGNLAGMDVWVAKLNSAGLLESQKCYGGAYGEGASSIAELSNGRLLISGTATTDDGDVLGAHMSDDPYSDAWIFEVNSIGEINWQKCLGGYDHDWATQLTPSSDNGFIMAGGTESFDGDVVGYHGATMIWGDGDIWVVKLSPVSTIVNSLNTSEAIRIFPNPCNEEITVTCSNDLAGKNYYINDLLGKSKIMGTLNSDNNPIDIESLSPGIYILTTEYGQSSKFVKSHE
jgi:hypothetical protein